MKNRSFVAIDDNPDALEILTLCLKAAGVTKIKTFTCPCEALAWFEQGGNPEVVVTDFHMPHMNGIMVADKIKEQYPQTEVVIYTGLPESVREQTDKHPVVLKGDFNSICQLFGPPQSGKNTRCCLQESDHS